MTRIFAVFGDDLRQRYVTEGLRRDGYLVRTYGVPGLPDTHKCLSDCLRGVDASVLPMPSFSDDGFVRSDERHPIPLTALHAAIPPGSILFGARLLPLPDGFPARVVDYGAFESLARRNAMLTAEGAIALAMTNLEVSIQDAQILVIGYGRIGRQLARKLRALDAVVTVSARKSEDIAEICANGFLADWTHLYSRGLGRYDCIMNTVPTTVLTGAQVGQTAGSCLLIELASAPFGIPQETAKMLRRRYLLGAALPGKAAPKTAGEIVKCEILNYMNRTS